MASDYKSKKSNSAEMSPRKKIVIGIVVYLLYIYAIFFFYFMARIGDGQINEIIYKRYITGLGILSIVGLIKLVQYMGKYLRITYLFSLRIFGYSLLLVCLILGILWLIFWFESMIAWGIMENVVLVSIPAILLFRWLFNYKSK